MVISNSNKKEAMGRTPKFRKGRIFLIECISPIDALNGTNEG
jgi:hypothetical protein